MDKENKDVLNAIQKFKDLLQSKPDTRESVSDFRQFFRYFLRTKHRKYSLPVLEMMSILKNEKPTVFNYLRKQGEQDAMLGMLTGSLISPSKADERLDEFMSKLH